MSDFDMYYNHALFGLRDDKVQKFSNIKYNIPLLEPFKTGTVG